MSLNNRFQRSRNTFVKNSCFQRCHLAIGLERSHCRIVQQWFSTKLFRIAERSFSMILFKDRWTFVFHNLFIGSFHDRLHRSNVSFVERPVSMMPYDYPWTIVFNDSLLWSSKDRFQPPLFDDRWTIVFNDPFTRLLNDRSQPSHLTIVERTFTTILVSDHITIIYNDPLLRPLNHYF